MAKVTLEKINKVYGRGSSAVHAVQDLDLEVNDGEFVALLGPSGCGKTSTLRMIVGLETITSGDIYFNARKVSGLDPQHRNVAMAFETYALYPNFSIEENLTFPLDVRGVSIGERRRRAHEIAEILQISDILDARPAQLSGGQQQRVSLGRALIREPAVFILDEVMSHLDAHLKFQMLFDLKKLHRELKRTMIYVTHDQVEALALADRVAVMSNARMQQIGDRNTLYNAPANVFVADFIGEPPTNFFPSAVKVEDGRVTLLPDGSDLVFIPHEGVGDRLKALGAHRAIAGIRPQNLKLGEDDPSVAATLLVNEYLGERSILTVTNGTAVFRALVPPEVRTGRGELVRFTYDRDHLMVFDAETEALIA